ncbi:MAG: efflux RND transporter periplasmic adaptor subunit, partial [Limisphaerales bacterium]
PPGAFAVQVVAVEARRRPVTETIPLVGSIAPNEMIEVKAETDGIVKEIGFDEGQRVEKGALLVALDQTKLQADLNEAQANAQLSRATFARTEELFRAKLLSQQEFDQAAATFAMNKATVERRERELKDARLIAPFSGITGARRISPGQVISRNTTLTWLVDLDTVKVEVNVPERVLNQLRVGQAVEFKVAAHPGETFRGEVYFISPQLDEGTRTALVKARIPNPDHKLRGGMFANLDLALQLRDQALVIPEPAIINNGDATMVFAVTSSNTAAMRPVKIGLRLAGKAEVLDGLGAGELVIVEGTQKLFPGAAVKLAGPEAAAAYVN